MREFEDAFNAAGTRTSTNTRPAAGGILKGRASKEMKKETGGEKSRNNIQVGSRAIVVLYTFRAARAHRGVFDAAAIKSSRSIVYSKRLIAASSWM